MKSETMLKVLDAIETAWSRCEGDPLPDEPNLTQVANFASITPQAIHPHIQKLCECGHIEKDGRRIALTDSGRRRLRICRSFTGGVNRDSSL